ncbi:glycoside hydrolase family 5 protein [Patescibacteria group bacterium]|nr:glycoside hydrolase family 5 protein [Patescibacteria group bacterium]
MRKFLTSVLLAAALIFAGGPYIVLATGVTWSNWSWGSQVSDINANPISWTPGGWGGLYLHTDTAIDPKAAASFNFTINNVPNGEKIRAFFYDQNNNQLPQLAEISSSGDYNYPINNPIKGFALQEGTGNNQPTITVSNINLPAPASTQDTSNTTNTSNTASNATYSDFSSWQNWSWNGQANIGSTITFQSGGQWAGLYLHSDTGINTGGFNYLSFNAKASQPGEKYRVILYDDNNQTTNLGNAIDNLDGSTVNIALSDLNGTNRVIKGIVFQDIGTVQGMLTITNLTMMANINNAILPAPAPLPIFAPAAARGSYTVNNGGIYQGSTKINLHGINWFGFETSTNVVHGLWARGYKDMISQIKSLGFNAVRLPYCPASVQGVATTSIDYSKNPDLAGLNSLQVMDKIVNEMSNQGIYVLLDSHRPDCNTQSELWYTGSYSEPQWINDLVTLAKRYAGVSNFIGLDLKNEPHGSATWGTGNSSTDWNLAAEKAGNAVLAANPNILVFVEGIGDNPTCQDSNGHFWGGNLAPVKCKTLNLPSNKYVYSPHVYGPDVSWQSYFGAGDFPNNMPAIWDSQWGYLESTNALAPGEWGGKYGTNGGSPADVTWENAFAKYLTSKGVCSSFYWDLNPNSGDTGGVLQDDWTTPVSSKVSLLQNYFNSCR